ncbi:MAG: DUF3822 family protein [Bacteroidota bacterium]
MTDTPSSKKYQLIFALEDKKFNVTQLSQYHLSLYISNTYMKICCVNPITNQCLLLKQYRLAHEHAYERIQAIEQLYQDHPILVAKDWSAVTLCIDNQQYALIPQTLFQEQQLSDYLSFSCPIGSDAMGHFTHHSLDVTVAFAIDSRLLNWFKATYKHTSLQIMHQASSLIQGTWKYLQGKSLSKEPKTLVFVEADSLHIMVMQSNHLIYYNRFVYANFEEFLYYILIVMRNLQLDTSEHEVILGGNIKKRSRAYKKIGHYIRKLRLIKALPDLKFGRNFPKEMMATHLDVLGAQRCYSDAPRMNN